MKRENLRNFLKAYRVGFDLWAIVLFAIIMLPNIIARCIPEFQAGLNTDTGALEISATVFQVLFVVLLVFIERKGEQRLNFRSPLVSVCGLAVLAYYIAWIFFFCFFLNAAVYLSLAIFPSAAFLVFEVERKNWFAFVPTSVFAILHLVSSCIAFLI